MNKAKKGECEHKMNPYCCAICMPRKKNAVDKSKKRAIDIS